MDSYLRATGLGAVAGMRSMTAPAALSLHFTRAIGRPRSSQPPAAWLASPRAATALSLLALGELVGDKLPFVPDRVDPLPLAGRAVAGALVGAAVVGANGGDTRRTVVGGLLGAAAAVAAAHLFYRLRRGAAERLGVPDPLLAFAEDALAIGAARALVRAQG